MTEQTNMDRAREWWAGGLTPEHEATDDYDEDVMRQVAALLDAAEERGRGADRERCAKAFIRMWDDGATVGEIADAIRAMGTK